MAKDPGNAPADDDGEDDNNPEDQESAEEPSTRKAIEALRQQFESTAHFVHHLMTENLLKQKLRLICL